MRWSVALLIAASLVACKSETLVAPASDPDALAFGMYPLQTIDGATLPFNLVQASRSIDVLSGSVELHTDKTFFDVLRYRLRTGSTAQIVADTTRGTYMYLGHQLAFQPNDGSDMYFLDVADGHTLESIDTGFLIEYRRP